MNRRAAPNVESCVTSVNGISTQIGVLQPTVNIALPTFFLKNGTKLTLIIIRFKMVVSLILVVNTEILRITLEVLKLHVVPLIPPSLT
jgi:hypothetical protein